MHVACSEGRVTVCEWLLENGFEATASLGDNQGWTPMLNSCQQGRLATCQWLVERGGAAESLHVSNADGITPIMVAVQEDQIEILDWIAGGGRGCVGRKSTRGCGVEGAWSQHLNGTSRGCVAWRGRVVKVGPTSEWKHARV